MHLQLLKLMKIVKVSLALKPLRLPFCLTVLQVKRNSKLSLVILLIFFFLDHYAVMPPLEQFMEIPSMDRRELFFRDIERGDIVIGRISSVREFGFFMVLICLGSGIMRDIAHLEITVSYFCYLDCFCFC